MRWLRRAARLPKKDPSGLAQHIGCWVGLYFFDGEVVHGWMYGMGEAFGADRRLGRDNKRDGIYTITLTQAHTPDLQMDPTGLPVSYIMRNINDWGCGNPNPGALAHMPSYTGNRISP